MAAPHMAAKAAPARGGHRTSLPIYDADVHHGIQSNADLVPYLAEEFRDRFARYGASTDYVSLANNGGVRGYRADLLVDGKVPAGTGVIAARAEITRADLLDGCGVDWALLTGGGLNRATFNPDLDYVNAIARAFNDFTDECWLQTDSRFRYAMMINERDPSATLREIERFGDRPGVVGVMLLAGATRPFGQRAFDAIHRACAERDLVWSIHFGSEGLGINPAPTAAGYPSYYGESRVNRAASYKTHLASFVFEGVFERYPNFKVAILEAGFAWVPAFLWSMDEVWSQTRAQTPWVKRPPSEYIVEHVRFASQPQDEPRPKGGLEKILAWMHAEKTLMFATDYPHWDWDDPAETFAELPDPLRTRIFSANAAEFFRS